MELETNQQSDKLVEPIAQSDSESPNRSTEAQTPKKKNKKVQKIVIAVIAALIVFGAAAATYFYLYLPNTPQNILLVGLYNTYADNQIKSGKLDGTLEMTGENAPKYLNDVVFTGSFNESDESYSILSDISGEKLGLDIIKIGEDKTYVKLSGASDAKALLKRLGVESYIDSKSAQTLDIIESLDGVWVEVDDTFKGITSSITGSFESTSLSKDDAQKVADLYKKYPFLQIDEVLADEDIGGEPSKHFKVSINQENHLAYLKGMKEAGIDNIFTNISEEEYKKNTGEVEQTYEIWISKSDKVINKMISIVKSKDSSTTMSTTKTNINEPVTITAPAGAMTFKEHVIDLLKKD